MKKLSKIIDRCQFSKKKDLKSVLSLGYLPAVNEVVKINKRNFSSNFFPTDLTYSKSSKLFQINNIVNKEFYERAKHFLDNKPTCIEIGKNAYNFVKQKHTGKARVEYIFSVIRNGLQKTLLGKTNIIEEKND